MTDSEATAHNEALIRANQERLRVLEIQAATYGNDTPPHIVTEISKIVATIRALTTVVDLTPESDPNAPRHLSPGQIERRRDASTNEQATLRMIATVQSTVAEVSNVKTALRDQIAEVRTEVREQIEDVRSDVREQLGEAKQNIDSQITTVEASIANVQAVVLTEVQNVHTTIDRVIKNGLRAIAIIVLVVGICAIALILYFRV